jgi:hypothetical protein
MGEATLRQGGRHFLASDEAFMVNGATCDVTESDSANYAA